MESIINIAVSSNANYFDGLLALIKSLRKKTPRKYNLRFFYLNDKELSYSQNKKICNSLNKSDEFIFCDTSIFQNDICKIKFTLSNWDSSIMNRLFIPIKFKNLVDKIIYIDTDIIVNDNIYNFYSNTDSCLIKGLQEQRDENITFINQYHIRDNLYLNSGVLVFNFKQWDVLFPNDTKYLDVIKKYSKNNFLYPDQDLINIIFDGYKRGEPLQKYEFVPGISLPKHKKYMFIHFASKPKPWEQNGFKRGYFLKFKRYVLKISDTLLIIKRILFVTILLISKFFPFFRKYIKY